MKKVGKTLRNLHPKMIRVTCLANALHRVAETVRSLYPDVEDLVSSGKKIFRKSPGRVAEIS